jgi:quercetin dioxygenase-like cupin family protein
MISWPAPTAGAWRGEAIGLGLPARILRRDGAGQAMAADISVPRKQNAFVMAASFTHPVELYVVSGAVRFGATLLGEGDYAYVPAGSLLPTPRSVGDSARLLMFVVGDNADPRPRRLMFGGDNIVLEQELATGTLDMSWRIVRGAEQPWEAATVDPKLKLQVKQFRRDSATGARTFLVKTGADFKIPWEVHDTVEEGYLVQGQFRLEECTRTGVRSDMYQPGGYFHRPAGVWHSGPNSGALGTQDAIFLIRTPVNLTARFAQSCPR